MPRTARLASQALLGLATLLAAVAAHAQVLRCGTLVTARVTLTSDVVCGPGQDGLIVGAHDVRINLNGFSIRGPWTAANPTGPAIGVQSAGYERVTLVGPGTIEGFERAVQIEGGVSHVVSGITAVTESGLPVSVRDASGVRVEFNRMNAFELVSTRGAKAVGNHIVGNDISPPGIPASAGVQLNGCGTADNVVAGNHVDARTRDAILLTEGAHANQVLDNEVVDGEIALDGTSNNLVARNLVANKTYGYTGVFIDASRHPVRCAGDYLVARRNIVRENRFEGGTVGVIVDNHLNTKVDAYNLVTGNTFSGLTTVALLFGPGSRLNDGRANTYVNNFADTYDYGYRNLWP